MGNSNSIITDQEHQNSSNFSSFCSTDSNSTMRPTKSTKKPELPAEVWVMILEQTRDNDDVEAGLAREPGPRKPNPNRVANQTTIALASTCRLVRSIADPFLWTRLNFHLPCAPEPNDPDAPPLAENVNLIQERGFECLAFLKQNPEIRALVKEFSVYVGPDMPVDDGPRALVALFGSLGRLLPMLPNLGSISITGASLPVPFLNAITHLEQPVQHVSITNCRWPVFPTKLEAGTLRLKTLSIRGAKWIHSWADQFLAQTDLLEEVDMDDSFPGTKVKDFPRLRRLAVNEVHIRHVDLFCRTLSHCPNLEDLTIVEAMMDPTFTSTAVPNLQILRGNILNCVFAQGRPVRTLDLSYPKPKPWGQDMELNIVFRRVLEVCGSGTVPVRALKISTNTCGTRYRWTCVEMQGIVKAFPLLEFLDVDIDPDVFYDCVPIAAGLRNLRAVSFRLPRTPERHTMEWQVKHKDAILVVGDFGNTLTNIAFTDGVEWIKGVNGWYAVDHLAS